MSRRGKILVVDDDEDKLEFLKEFLVEHGFNVDLAETADQALGFLSEHIYHVLVLDINLEAGDSENREGMELLKRVADQELNLFMNIVMLSAYGTRDEMRQAFSIYGVVDFIYKPDLKIYDFLRFVQQKISKNNHQRPINLDLDISWQDVNGPEQLVLGLEVNGGRIGQDSSVQVDQAVSELDDLLCRLFAEANHLMVSPLAPGHSGCGVIRTRPFYAGGARAQVVKFGDFRKIDEENDNFERYVKYFAQGARFTAVLNKARTLHFGGVIYSLLGSSTDQFEDLGSYYRRSSITAIKKTLDNLFNTCGLWYAGRGQLMPVNLTSEYEKALGFTREKLERALTEQFPGVEGKDQLRFRSLDSEQVFDNPLLALSAPPKIAATYICTTHGDFNEQNILLDKNGSVWLIDFFRTGPSHILRDVAQLDAVIRFQF
ncbi:MAG TPA: response regulator, partial [Ktedonobacteraceae bacterium]